MSLNKASHLGFLLRLAGLPAGFVGRIARDLSLLAVLCAVSPSRGAELWRDDVDEAQILHKDLNYVVIPNAQVVLILPDDMLQRWPRQKWIVQLSNGTRIMAVYDLDQGKFEGKFEGKLEGKLDQGKRVPVRLGEYMTLAGAYLWRRKGGLIHSLHSDPTGQRPDGYVEIERRKFGSGEQRVAGH